jgi:hypothetical protein
VVHRREQVHLGLAVVTAAAQGLAVDRDGLPPRRPVAGGRVAKGMAADRSSTGR